ncbi:carbohydrate ABC transporter permease [Corynebacterium uterequi]|uniref:ABC-type sugar transport system, permease component n=1 Tax=Corynebacterium uterequi TaxID=1072256 RepID=A0A0G3HHB6_9CORY|nr:carbohydrate ABC transporter permease [Corynebacterium uterequi]AKK10572.1 ABC-type sugar transport system, permease component [Corynebacterium uterequi]
METNTTANRISVIIAWIVAFIWVFPLLFVMVMAFRVDPNDWNLAHGWTIDNIIHVWNAAPFGTYYRNSILLVLILTSSQVVFGVLAAYAFARFDFPGSGVLFSLVLAQLVVYPEIMLSENYQLVAELKLVDSLPGIALPYLASAFAIFLLRQSFKTVPLELVEAAEMEGFGRFKVLWSVYIPLCRPSIVAFALISVSFHWNNFLWPLVITRTADARPLTVGIVRFLAPESGIDFASLTAGTFIVVMPLLIFFIALQKQFVQSFMRAGIK